MQGLFQNVVSSLTLCNAFWDCIHKGYADLKEHTGMYLKVPLWWKSSF